MHHAAEGAEAWDWEHPAVTAAVEQLRREYDPQFLLLIGIICLQDFCATVATEPGEELVWERDAVVRMIHIAGEFGLSNEHVIRAVWVTLCSVVGGIWAVEAGRPKPEGVARVRRAVSLVKTKAPGAESGG